jgi:cytidylate kinase
MSEKNIVITINREYCAGGRSVAKILSDRLGIPWYDRDFIMKAASITGLSYDKFVKDGEDLSSTEKFLDGFLSTSSLYRSTHDEVYQAERKAIIELAQKPCIIIGRCSDEACREAAIPAVKVYLYASEAAKLQRTIELHEYPEGADPKKYMLKRDRERRTFYRTYVRKYFDNVHNYDLCVDTTNGYEQAADAILAYLSGK